MEPRADETKPGPADAPGRVPRLAAGLVRNTVWNTAGRVWLVLLSVVSIPFLLRHLGKDVFGVLSLTTIATSYLGLLSNPVSSGSVRFLAEAYGREDWTDYRWQAVMGFRVNLALAVLGALCMSAGARWLAYHGFAIPPEIREAGAAAFMLAAAAFAANRVAAFFQGIPCSMRRFDLSNAVSLAVVSAGILASVGVVWLGGGLLDVAVAQFATACLGVLAFGILAFILLRRLPGSFARTPRRPVSRELLRFSGVLFCSQVLCQVGLLSDRLLVGMLAGTAAVAYYTVPTRITDRIPDMIGGFTAALYPLSAESKGSGRQVELAAIYRNMVRLAMCFTGLAAAVLIGAGDGILGLWIGSDFSRQSALILTLLAAGTVGRGAAGVAYAVTTGLGLNRFLIGMTLLTALIAAPVAVFTVLWGATGAAAGMCLGMAVQTLVFDLLTRRRIDPRWSVAAALAPYAQVAAAAGGAIAAARLLIGQATGWWRLGAQLLLIAGLYFGIGALVGLLRRSDVRWIVSRLRTSRLGGLAVLVKAGN
jgi:O-antigen/teichoic acid export membrane protein